MGKFAIRKGWILKNIRILGLGYFNHSTPRATISISSNREGKINTIMGAIVDGKSIVISNISLSIGDIFEMSITWKK